MSVQEEAAGRSRKSQHICKVCGKAEGSIICDECSRKIQLEALARKRHEEDGNAWSHWE